MQLKDLAKLAADLPTLEFGWSGKENWHDDVFKHRIADGDHKALVEYVDAIRQRLADVTVTLHRVVDAYTALKGMILEAQIDDLTP